MAMFKVCIEKAFFLNKKKARIRACFFWTWTRLTVEARLIKASKTAGSCSTGEKSFPHALHVEAGRSTSFGA
jgi:hypothetical protein